MSRVEVKSEVGESINMMKIEFLLLSGYGEQSERKTKQISLFFPLLARLAAMQRGLETAIPTLNLCFCLLEPAGGI